MRCISKMKKCIILVLVCVLLAGCGNVSYTFAYDPDYSVSSFRIVNSQSHDKSEPFASDLCVIQSDILNDETDMTDISSAALFDVNNSKVLYAKNVHEKLYPASLTKVMTALVALKNGKMEDTLTASQNVVINEPGATLCGVKPGDTMTLSQALHALLIYSGNDVAVMIAEHIGGSVEGFTDMMNKEAKALGATNSNFVNPHGLSDDNHYVTAYDMYLIFNEAIKYDMFTEIIHMASYDTTYYDSSGNPKELSIGTSNRYLNGNCPMPENVTVIGGKTGTTNAARSCLILLAKDTFGNSYISIIMRAETRDILYEGMSDLLGLIY